jgi:gamma-glutamylcyclotransferase (GGCT)/AIG2-like uncharacterized protein YtfP
MLITEISDQLPIYYFAYGMLTSPRIMSQTAAYTNVPVEAVGKAELKNHKLEMYHFANVAEETGSTVFGVLWKLDRKVIAELDAIEGYPQMYDRRTKAVYVDGKKYAAEVYMMTPETLESFEGSVASKTYINKVKQGYKHFKVPYEQVEKAVDEALDKAIDKIFPNLTPKM